MDALNGIKGIGKASLQLLEAAGIRDAEQLAAQDVDALFAELKRANDVLGISKRPPGKATVRKWISSAMVIAGTTPEPVREEEIPRESSVATPDGPVVNPKLAEMLSRAPCAIPLPGRIMVEKGLAVSDIPAGLPLSRYSGDPDLRVDAPNAPRTDVPLQRAPANPAKTEKKPERRQFDVSSARPMTPSAANGKRIPKSKPHDYQDRVSLIRAPLEQTNRGKDPKSRNYIRGVMHTDPWSIRIGAIFSLMLLVNLPLSIIAAFLLLVSREFQETFSWVPEWFLAFPVALPFIGLGYMIWGFSGKCRICNQKLFVHKAALKHVNSHRLPRMGYIVPLCIHLLLFNWFRCSSCGTPVRLKM
jgi:hypothetical protein